MPAFDHRHHALVRGPVRTGPSVPVLVLHVDLLVRAVQDDVADLLRELLPRGLRREAVRVRDGVQDPVPVLDPAARPRRERALGDRQVGVGDDERGVDLEADAEAVAGLARAVRRVEREVPRLELVEREPVERARQGLAVGLDVLAVVGLHRDRDEPLRQLQGRLDRVRDPPPDVRLGDEPVDDDLDRVLVVAGEPDRLGQLADLPVDPGPDEPLAREVLQELLVLALAPPDHRREHLEPGPLGQLHDLVDDLLGRLAADRPAALGAVRVSDPGVQHPEVVVDLGDGPHRGPGVAGG